MNDNVTLVATSIPNPDEEAAMLDYVQGVMPLFFELGGTIVKRCKLATSVVGEPVFTFLFIMDFPSKQALLAMLNGPAYQRLIPAREKGFNKIEINLVEDFHPNV